MLKEFCQNEAIRWFEFAYSLGMKKLSAYRSVRSKAPWILALDGKSGVYVIRSRISARILYVGESHSGRLKKTMLRHFQEREGKTSGPTYGRLTSLVAVRTTRKNQAQPTQEKLIVRLNPRDNFEDEVPF